MNEKTAGHARDEGTPGVWTAYAASALAFGHAAVSFHWAAGGTAGLSTIGGALEELGRTREPALIALVWIAGLLKVAAGLLALALVRPWRQALPRRVLLAAAWGGAALLTAYGGLLVRAVVYVVAVYVIAQMRLGKRWARITLAVLLGGIGTLSLVIDPISWLAGGNSLGQIFAQADILFFLVAPIRAVYLAAVVTALVFMFLPAANDYFRRASSAAGYPESQTAAEPIGPRLRPLNARVRPGFGTIDENEGAKCFRLP